MPKYRAKAKTLISHLCRVVEEGEVFEAEFPEKMKLGENLELVKEPSSGPKEKSKTGGTDAQ